jgi:hypothetical protein
VLDYQKPIRLEELNDTPNKPRDITAMLRGKLKAATSFARPEPAL